MLTRSIQRRIDAAGLTAETATITACGHVFNRDELDKVLRDTGVCPQCTQKINRPHIWGPCLPCTMSVWRDEMHHITHMLNEIAESNGNTVKKLKLIKIMFAFMLNTPGFLMSAASCKFGTAIHAKIADFRLDSRTKPLNSIMTCVEDALCDESLRFSSPS